MTNDHLPHSKPPPIEWTKPISTPTVSFMVLTQNAVAATQRGDDGLTLKFHPERAKAAHTEIPLH